MRYITCVQYNIPNRKDARHMHTVTMNRLPFKALGNWSMIAVMRISVDMNCKRKVETFMIVPRHNGTVL